ncbi:MAG: hypothetical protein VR68_00440 [Peptococcaceae bacterium BRH_c4a]|nr:MAG: hypothetical protein VR68_00440 [Peptococcaceae bacterium BRH_c4a]
MAYFLSYTIPFFAHYDYIYFSRNKPVNIKDHIEWQLYLEKQSRIVKKSKYLACKRFGKKF